MRAASSHITVTLKRMATFQRDDIERRKDHGDAIVDSAHFQARCDTALSGYDTIARQIGIDHVDLANIKAVEVASQ